jgi:hypothetical protein
MDDARSIDRGRATSIDRASIDARSSIDRARASSVRTRARRRPRDRTWTKQRA